MNKLKPKLFSVMKTYNKNQLFKDIIAGIIVAIIALPLSIALAIASGVSPEQGLYTAIFAGFFISFLGGSRVQIGGPTAAFVVIIYGIVTEFGMAGLTIATIMAGIMLILMGIFKFGSLIKYIPYTITCGFTAGVAIGIFAGQIKDFLGLEMGSVPAEFIEKCKEYAKVITTVDRDTVIVGVISLIILIIMPKISKVVPGSLVAIIVATLLVKFTPLETATIGSVYGELSSSLPKPSIPDVNMDMIGKLMSSAFTIAILAGIESLLSCVVSDGMINSRHRSNMELIGQGVGNIASGIFGGIPATGAIARTAANVKNGGRTPIAGMVHALTLLLILKLFMPLAALIPMTTLAAILIVVAYNMGEWKEFFHLIKHAPKSDVAILLVTFLLTVIFDLVVAIEFGLILTALLFIKRMSDVSSIRGWTYRDGEDDSEENDPMHIALKTVPEGTLVYEIDGPMFFGVADNFLNISVKDDTRVLILRMRSVPAMDITALQSLEKVYDKCKKKDVTVLLSHVNEQPMKVMEKAGFAEKIGAENFCENIDAALVRAGKLV
ncbi:MAG: STAS domain-containing protein [Lachnospiraceae bacterium]|nr:STAS domain-containing protein [Lachnospiraceae bacterium]